MDNYLCKIVAIFFAVACVAVLLAIAIMGPLGLLG